jgi:hypothetical protein
MTSQTVGYLSGTSHQDISSGHLRQQDISDTMQDISDSRTSQTPNFKKSPPTEIFEFFFSSYRYFM